jgi:hypothetical protein
MNDAVLESLAQFFEEATNDGLYPIVVYGINQNTDTIVLLTTSIPNFSHAINVLKTALKREYNLGQSAKPADLEQLAKENPHVFRLHRKTISSLGERFSSEERRREIGKVVSMFGAPFFQQKAFGLVDICGFSRLSHAEQLSYLYSLTNVLSSAKRRVSKFCRQLNVKPIFGQASTGDGFYFWHDSLGGGADVAVFMLLLCVMTQAEAMRQQGFGMRLKAAYVIDSAFMIYDPATQVTLDAVASNAVGQATNFAARLISAAKPSQILVGDFERSGQGKHEILNPEQLIAQANQIFREEGAGAASLDLKPKEKLRVVDKHGDSWYCWNVAGEVPNSPGGGEVVRQKIGLEPDPTKDIMDVAFKLEP